MGDAPVGADVDPGAVEIVLRRLGSAGETKILEIVLELNDVVPVETPTPRIVQVRRLYSRGDLSVLADHGLQRIAYTADGEELLSVSAASGHQEDRAVGVQVEMSMQDSVLRPGHKKLLAVPWVAGHVSVPV